MKKISILLLCSAIAFNQSCNNSASNDSVSKADSANNSKDTVSSLSNQDTAALKGGVNSQAADFAVKAANAGMTEVQIGSYAAKNASDKDVKDYAAMIVKDHTKANDELKGLATSKNITLPDSISNDNKNTLNVLMSKTGKDFDKAYMNQMVKDHKDAVDLFQNASDNQADSALKTFAGKTLPALKEHLQHAQSIVKEKGY